MNKGLIQIEDKFYQESNVIMLATNKSKSALDRIMESPLCLLNTDELKIVDNTLRELFKMHLELMPEQDLTNGAYQHLYFLSNEEIKEGDYYYRKGMNEIDYWDKDGSGSMKYSKYCKKVIATTNPELNYREELIGIGRESKEIKIPRPSNSFLEAFVREYNKGNKIEKVLVEYEKSYFTHTKGQARNDVPRCIYCGREWDDSYFNQIKCTEKELIFKVAPDNTITVKPLEKSLSYWKNNAKENYITTPISVLRYISELEKTKILDEMFLNMQHYMEYCKRNGYVTPKDWIEKHKHF